MYTIGQLIWHEQDHFCTYHISFGLEKGCDKRFCQRELVAVTACRLFFFPLSHSIFPMHGKTKQVICSLRDSLQKAPPHLCLQQWLHLLEQKMRQETFPAVLIDYSREESRTLIDLKSSMVHVFLFMFLSWFQLMWFKQLPATYLQSW